MTEIVKCALCKTRFRGWNLYNGHRLPDGCKGVERYVGEPDCCAEGHVQNVKQSAWKKRAPVEAVPEGRCRVLMGVFQDTLCGATVTPRVRLLAGTVTKTQAGAPECHYPQNGALQPAPVQGSGTVLVNTPGRPKKYRSEADRRRARVAQQTEYRRRKRRRP